MSERAEELKRLTQRLDRFEEETHQRLYVIEKMLDIEPKPIVAVKKSEH